MDDSERIEQVVDAGRALLHALNGVQLHKLPHTVRDRIDAFHGALNAWEKTRPDQC